MSQTSFSDIQLLLYAFAHVSAGISLLNDPAKLLRQVAPLTRLIEDQTGLAPSALPEQALAFIGVLLLGIAFYSGMSVYTLDEKFKRNSTPGRVLIGMAGVYVCTKTPNGNSLLALYSALNVFTGLLMGFTVGFGDGNAVDLEIAEKEALAKKRAATAVVAK